MATQAKCFNLKLCCHHGNTTGCGVARSESLVYQKIAPRRVPIKRKINLIGIGFSFVSAVEIIYWLTIRLLGNITLSKKKNSKREKKRSRAQSFLSIENNISPE